MTAPSASRRVGAHLSGQGLTFLRGPRKVLDEVSLDLASGEVVALLGANGAGKSTLFRLLLGFLRPKAGRVTVDGTALGALGRREIARRIAYVPQGHVTPFPYSVAEVVLMGRMPETGILRPPSAADRTAAMVAIDRLGIGHLAGRPYTDVSGGERQLALIARALAQGAGLILMDEPTTGLDFGYQVRLLDILAGLAGDGHAILFSTHNPEHALSAASRVVVLDGGRISDDGSPAEVVTPAMIRRIYGVSIAAIASVRRA